MTSNRNLPLILFTLLLSSFLLAYYFYFIKPIKSEAEFRQNDIFAANEQIAVLEARKEALEWETDAETDTELLKKLPKNRELTQVIQLLQEAELITESRVQTITFNDYEGEIPESLIPPQPVIEEEEQQQQQTSDEAQTEVTEPIEQSNSENDAENLAPVSEIALIPLPEELKLLTLEVTVEHKDYEQFLLYLKEVEQNERIFKIDSIALVLPGELIEPENLTTITSTIQMTTFYMK